MERNPDKMEVLMIVPVVSKSFQKLHYRARICDTSAINNQKSNTTFPTWQAGSQSIFRLAISSVLSADVPLHWIGSITYTYYKKMKNTSSMRKWKVRVFHIVCRFWKRTSTKMNPCVLVPISTLTAYLQIICKNSQLISNIRLNDLCWAPGLLIGIFSKDACPVS